MTAIADNLWLDANLHPSKGRAEFGINIPDLPADGIQVRFGGRHGRDNLQPAFDFYKFVLQHMPSEQRGRLSVIDFGGGWGRILRFFLREFPATRLVLVDCLTDAIKCAQSLTSPYAIIQNEAVPPLPLEQACADCCYAFSVFSHLSEQACLSWLAHLGELLVPGGTLIFTTRGEAQIRLIRQLLPNSDHINSDFRAGKDGAAHGHALTTLLPHPDELQRLYRSGKFQFYPTGGGGELTADFYGETWVPPQWMEANYRSLGFSQYEFFTEFATIDQCVFVLTK